MYGRGSSPPAWILRGRICDAGGRKGRPYTDGERNVSAEMPVSGSGR